jgi:hypothetical protein
LTPNLAWVLEIAHQFLFLGIYTDDRLSFGLMFGSLVLNVLKLLISIRMLPAF